MTIDDKRTANKAITHSKDCSSFLLRKLRQCLMTNVFVRTLDRMDRHVAPEPTPERYFDLYCELEIVEDSNKIPTVNELFAFAREAEAILLCKLTNRAGTVTIAIDPEQLTVSQLAKSVEDWAGVMRPILRDDDRDNVNPIPGGDDGDVDDDDNPIPGHEEADEQPDPEEDEDDSDVDSEVDDDDEDCDEERERERERQKEEDDEKEREREREWEEQEREREIEEQEERQRRMQEDERERERQRQEKEEHERELGENRATEITDQNWDHLDHDEDAWELRRLLAVADKAQLILQLSAVAKPLEPTVLDAESILVEFAPHGNKQEMFKQFRWSPALVNLWRKVSRTSQIA